MLKKRIIPVILHRGYQAVKAKQFQADRNIGFVRQQVMIHEQRQSDEIFLLDIGATPDGREPNWKLISDLTSICMTPVCIGGGIRTLEHIQLALKHGADKVAICTHACLVPEFIQRAARKYGSQAIVVSIDVRGGHVHGFCGQVDYWYDPVDWAKIAECYGAGEILLNNIERDGMMQGYDIELIERVSAAVNIPVVACGGAGCYRHLHEALNAGAHGVAASAMWSFLDLTQADAADYLAKQGVPVRQQTIVQYL